MQWWGGLIAGFFLFIEWVNEESVVDWVICWLIDEEETIH